MKKWAGFLVTFILFVMVLPLGSCHKKLIEAMDTYEERDEYLIFYRNGKVVLETRGKSVHGSKRKKVGRYYLSADTVFLARKSNDKTANASIFGIIDTTRKLFLYRPDIPNRYTIFTLTRYHALKVP